MLGVQVVQTQGLGRAESLSSRGLQEMESWMKDDGGDADIHLGRREKERNRETVRGNRGNGAMGAF